MSSSLEVEPPDLGQNQTMDVRESTAENSKSSVLVGGGGGEVVSNGGNLQVLNNRKEEKRMETAAAGGGEEEDWPICVITSTSGNVLDKQKEDNCRKVVVGTKVMTIEPVHPPVPHQVPVPTEGTQIVRSSISQIVAKDLEKTIMRKKDEQEGMGMGDNRSNEVKINVIRPPVVVTMNKMKPPPTAVRTSVIVEAKKSLPPTTKERRVPGSDVFRYCDICRTGFLKDEQLDEHMIKAHPGILARRKGSISPGQSQSSSSTSTKKEPEQKKAAPVPTPPKPTQPIICDLCDKKFLLRGHYEEHRRSHLAEVKKVEIESNSNRSSPSPPALPTVKAGPGPPPLQPIVKEMPPPMPPILKATPPAPPPTVKAAPPPPPPTVKAIPPPPPPTVKATPPPSPPTVKETAPPPPPTVKETPPPLTVKAIPQPSTIIEAPPPPKAPPVQSQEPPKPEKKEPAPPPPAGPPYKCTQCDRTFPLPFLLKKHNISHHHKPYACSLCPVRFQTIEALNLHKRLIHDVAGMSTYKCLVCGKNDFLLLSDLFTHRIEDHNQVPFQDDREKPYGCGVCCKPYQRKGDALVCAMLGHDPTQLHNAMFRHKCPQCFEEGHQDLGYHSIRALKKHWLKAHVNNRFPQEQLLQDYHFDCPLPKVHIDKRAAYDLKKKVVDAKPEEIEDITKLILEFDNLQEDQLKFKGSSCIIPIFFCPEPDCVLNFSDIDSLRIHENVHVKEEGPPPPESNNSSSSSQSKRGRPPKKDGGLGGGESMEALETGGDVDMETNAIQLVEKSPAPISLLPLTSRGHHLIPKFGCVVCGKKFRKLKRLREHEQSHRNMDPDCPIFPKMPGRGGGRKPGLATKKKPVKTYLGRQRGRPRKIPFWVPSTSQAQAAGEGGGDPDYQDHDASDATSNGQSPVKLKMKPVIFRPHRCQQCPATFRLPKSLRMHELNVHNAPHRKPGRKKGMNDAIKKAQKPHQQKKSEGDSGSQPPLAPGRIRVGRLEISTKFNKMIKENAPIKICVTGEDGGTAFHFQCPICPKVFRDRRGIHLHILGHSVKTLKYKEESEKMAMEDEEKKIQQQLELDDDDEEVEVEEEVKVKSKVKIEVDMDVEEYGGKKRESVLPSSIKSSSQRRTSDRERRIPRKLSEYEVDEEEIPNIAEMCDPVFKPRLSAGSSSPPSLQQNKVFKKRDGPGRPRKHPPVGPPRIQHMSFRDAEGGGGGMGGSSSSNSNSNSSFSDDMKSAGHSGAGGEGTLAQFRQISGEIVKKSGAGRPKAQMPTLFRAATPPPPPLSIEIKDNEVKDVTKPPSVKVYRKKSKEAPEDEEMEKDLTTPPPFDVPTCKVCSMTFESVTDLWYHGNQVHRSTKVKYVPKAPAQAPPSSSASSNDNYNKKEDIDDKEKTPPRLAPSPQQSTKAPPLITAPPKAQTPPQKGPAVLALLQRKREQQGNLGQGQGGSSPTRPLPSISSTPSVPVPLPATETEQLPTPPPPPPLKRSPFATEIIKKQEMKSEPITPPKTEATPIVAATAPTAEIQIPNLDDNLPKKGRPPKRKLLNAETEGVNDIQESKKQGGDQDQTEEKSGVGVVAGGDGDGEKAISETATVTRIGQLKIPAKLRKPGVLTSEKPLIVQETNENGEIISKYKCPKTFRDRRGFPHHNRCHVKKQIEDEEGEVDTSGSSGPSASPPTPKPKENGTTNEEEGPGHAPVPEAKQKPKLWRAKKVMMEKKVPGLIPLKGASKMVGRPRKWIVSNNIPGPSSSVVNGVTVKEESPDKPLEKITSLQSQSSEPVPSTSRTSSMITPNGGKSPASFENSPVVDVGAGPSTSAVDTKPLLSPSSNEFRFKIIKQSVILPFKKRRGRPSTKYLNFMKAIQKVPEPSKASTSSSSSSDTKDKDKPSSSSESSPSNIKSPPTPSDKETGVKTPQIPDEMPSKTEGVNKEVKSTKNIEVTVTTDSSTPTPTQATEPEAVTSLQLGLEHGLHFKKKAKLAAILAKVDTQTTASSPAPTPVPVTPAPRPSVIVGGPPKEDVKVNIKKIDTPKENVVVPKPESVQPKIESVITPTPIVSVPKEVVAEAEVDADLPKTPKEEEEEEEEMDTSPALTPTLKRKRGRPRKNGGTSTTPASSKSSTSSSVKASPSAIEAPQAPAPPAQPITVPRVSTSKLPAMSSKNTMSQERMEALARELAQGYMKLKEAEGEIPKKKVGRPSRDKSEAGTGPGTPGTSLPSSSSSSSEKKEESAEDSSMTPPGPSQKRRGRPPKKFAHYDSPVPVVTVKRLEERSTPTAAPAIKSENGPAAEEEAPITGVKRGRGRPRKNPASAPTTPAEGLGSGQLGQRPTYPISIKIPKSTFSPDIANFVDNGGTEPGGPVMKRPRGRPRKSMPILTKEDLRRSTEEEDHELEETADVKVKVKQENDDPAPTSSRF